MSTELFVIAEVMTGKLNALVKNIMRQTGANDPNEAVRLVNSGKWIVSESTRDRNDNIIRVDHSVRPSYPDWAETVMHPELENTGSAEYDISTVEQWLHPGQKNGQCIEGKKIYSYLKDTDTLKTCLGLRDLEEIQKKGIAFFRKHFQNKVVSGWKGIVRHRLGSLYAPVLCDGGEVVLGWYWLDADWLGGHPALRLASSAKA